MARRKAARRKTVKKTKASTGKSFFETLGEILNQPLPGTKKQAPPPVPEAAEKKDDQSLFDQIIDVLNQPLPGTAAPKKKTAAKKKAGRKKTARKTAHAPGHQPAGPAGDWMAREAAAFAEHQRLAHGGLLARQQHEQEAFFRYQQEQAKNFEFNQKREAKLFEQYQRQRLAAWKQQLRAQQQGLRIPAGWHPGAPPPPGWAPGAAMPAPPPPGFRPRARRK